MNSHWGGMQFLVVMGAMLLCMFGCSHKKHQDTMTPEVQAYERPSDASIRLEGQQFPYCLWYNPSKWIIFDTPFDACDDVSEWTLVLVDLDQQASIGKDVEKRAFAKTYTYEEKSVSKASYKEFVQAKILGQDKESLLAFKDLGSEERLVNNIKVLFWKFMVDYEGVGSITTLLYFYSDNEGSVAVTTFTPTADLKRNEADMEALLNGFCLLQSGT